MRNRILLMACVLCMAAVFMGSTTTDNKISSLENEVETLETKLSKAQDELSEEKRKAKKEYEQMVSPYSEGRQKSYMDYRTITATDSPQYALTRQASTDSSGLMHVDGYYCVALGSAYGSEIGSKYRITLSTGKWFNAVLADQKSDGDTDQSKTVAHDGSVVEFVVNGAYLNGSIRNLGDVSALPQFRGSVMRIEREV